MSNHFSTYLDLLENHFESVYKGTLYEESSKRWLEGLKKHSLGKCLDLRDESLGSYPEIPGN